MSARPLISTTRVAPGPATPTSGRPRFTATDPRPGEFEDAFPAGADAAGRLAEAVLATGGGMAGQALLALLERMPGRLDRSPHSGP